jgi:CheY-like chemotaxis protein
MNTLNNGTILFLDDDTFLVKIYEEKFRDAGCHIQVAHAVDEAVRMLRGGFVPDVVIYDLELKEKDGFQFMQILKEQHLAQGAYCIALTNHSGENDREKAMELGTHAYIVKAEMIPDEVVRMALEAVTKKARGA